MPIGAASPFNVVLRTGLFLKSIAFFPVHLAEFLAEFFRGCWNLKVEIAVCACCWGVAFGMIYAQNALMTGISAVYEDFVYPIMKVVVDVLVMIKYVFVGDERPGGSNGLRGLWNFIWEIIAAVVWTAFDFIIYLITDPRFTQLLTDIFNFFAFLFGGPSPFDLAGDLAYILVDLFFNLIDFILIVIKFLTLLVGAPGVFYGDESWGDAWVTWGNQIFAWFLDTVALIGDFITAIFMVILEFVLSFIFDVWDFILAVLNCVINLGDCICNPGTYFSGATRFGLFDFICPTSNLNPTILQETIRNYTLSKLSLSPEEAQNRTRVKEAFILWATSLVNKQVPVEPNSRCSLLNEVGFSEHTSVLAPPDQITYVGCAAVYMTSLYFSNLTVADYDPEKLKAIPMNIGSAIQTYGIVSKGIVSSIVSAVRSLGDTEVALARDIQTLTLWKQTTNSTGRPRTFAQYVLDRTATSIEAKVKTMDVNPLARGLLDAFAIRASVELRNSFSLEAQLEHRQAALGVTRQLSSRLINIARLALNASRVMGEVVDRLYEKRLTINGSLQLTAKNIYAYPDQVEYLQGLAIAGAVNKTGELYTFVREQWANRSSTKGFVNFQKMNYFGFHQNHTRNDALKPMKARGEYQRLRPQALNREKEGANIETLFIAGIEAIGHIWDPTWEWHPENYTSTVLRFFFNLNQNHKICMEPSSFLGLGIFPTYGPHWCWWDPDNLGLVYYFTHFFGACEVDADRPAFYDDSYVGYSPPAGGWHGYNLDPHPQLNFTFYSLQCFPRYSVWTFAWLVALPTEIFAERFWPFYDLCKYVPERWVPCSDHESCRFDLGFYDALDNIIFLLEELQTSTHGAIAVNDFMRNNTAFRYVITQVGLINYLDAALQNFNFHGQKVSMGWWTCFYYTLLQVGLFYSLLWVSAILLIKTWPTATKTLSVFEDTFHMLISIFTFRWNRAIVSSIHGVEDVLEGAEVVVQTTTSLVAEKYTPIPAAEMDNIDPMPRRRTRSIGSGPRPMHSSYVKSKNE